MRSPISFIKKLYPYFGPAPKTSLFVYSATELDTEIPGEKEEVEGEEGLAYYRYVLGSQPHFMIGKGNKEAFGASVRCVRTSTIAQ